MSAIEIDIDLYNNRDFNLTVYWYDENDVAVDITDYGATLAIKKGYNTQEEVVNVNDVDGGILVGTTDGKFTISIPRSSLKNLNFKTGVYEMIVYPTSGDSEVNPITLLIGLAHYHNTVVNITEP